MSTENQYFGGPGSDQTPDVLLGLPCIHHESGWKECTFLIDHRVVEEYLNYCHLLAYSFCKIHVYILLGSQKTPESGRKVKTIQAIGFVVTELRCHEINMNTKEKHMIRSILNIKYLILKTMISSQYSLI